jgi:hypothetical protein
MAPHPNPDRNDHRTSVNRPTPAELVDRHFTKRLEIREIAARHRAIVAHRCS